MTDVRLDEDDGSHRAGRSHEARGFANPQQSSGTTDRSTHERAHHERPRQPATNGTASDASGPNNQQRAIGTSQIVDEEHGRRNSRGGRTMSTVMAVGLMVASLAACAGASSTSEKSAGSPGPSGSSAQAATTGYASTSFVVPFDVAPPSWLDAQPQIEQANFVTWEAPDLPAVRFLAPVNVYRPGNTTATDVPPDYVGYLLGQARNGGHFADQVEEDIDGRPATLVTATTDRALDGSLGCPTATTSAAECFGLQPNLVLRIAAVNIHDQTLLIWLRMDKNTDQREEQGADQGVRGHARHRPVQRPGSHPGDRIRHPDSRHIADRRQLPDEHLLATNQDSRCALRGWPRGHR